MACVGIAGVRDNAAALFAFIIIALSELVGDEADLLLEDAKESVKEFTRKDPERVKVEVLVS